MGIWDFYDQLPEEKKSALTQSLMTTGLSLLATPPTPYKQSFGQNIGQAGLQGMQTYQSALSEHLKQRLMNMQLKKLGMDEALQPLTMQNLQAELAKKQQDVAGGMPGRNVYDMKVGNTDMTGLPPLDTMPLGTGSLGTRYQPGGIDFEQKRAKTLLESSQAFKALNVKPKISGHITTDAQGKPTFLDEYGSSTNIPAYFKPSDVEPYKVGTIRAFDVGDSKVYKQYGGNGEWEDMEGVGGARFKTATGKKSGGVKNNITNKEAVKYQENLEAYNREKASLEDMYNQSIQKYPGNSRNAIINRNLENEKYGKETDRIVKKYRGKIDFVSRGSSPQSSQGSAKEWTASGKRYRIDPVTGKTQMYMEDGS